MNISIIGRQIDIGETLNNHIFTVINEYKKYNLNVISTNVIIKKEKKEYKVELIFNIKGKNTIVINASDKDVYSAIDKAQGKGNKAFRRLASKIKDHHQKSLRDLEIINEDDFELEKEPELIQMTLKLQKPLDIDEALDKLKNQKAEFLVFNDHDGTQRIIFKREDGNIGVF